jgi:hypothetical protein
VNRLTLPLVAIALVAGACASSATAKDPTTTTIAAITTLPPATTTVVETTTTTEAPEEPPALTTSIEGGEVVDTYVRMLSGTTDPGATITIDGSGVEVAADGSFAEAPTFNTIGDTTVVVSATSPSGMTTTRRITYSFAPGDGWAAAIGDSVMLGCRDEIEKRLGVDIVDATVSRQFLAAPDLVRSLIDRPEPPELIIIGLGTNGPVQARHFDEVMEIAADVPLVAFVNVRVPRSWEATSNTEIAEGVARYANAVLVDWYSVTKDRDDLFAADGVHPKQPGRVIMGELIAEAVFPGWTPLDD